MVTMQEILEAKAVANEDITSRIRRHYSPHALAKSDTKARKTARRILRNGELDKPAAHPDAMYCSICKDWRLNTPMVGDGVGGKCCAKHNNAGSFGGPNSPSSAPKLKRGDKVKAVTVGKQPEREYSGYTLLDWRPDIGYKLQRDSSGEIFTVADKSPELKIVLDTSVTEDAPFKAPPTAGNPQQHTSDDIGNNFLSEIAHASGIHQAEILGMLFGDNWDHPHTAEEISAAYVGADIETRAAINDMLDISNLGHTSDGDIH